MSAKKQRLVVVGNGMIGMRTVEELLKRAPGRYDITVFGAEPHPNYNRILLSSVLAGDKTLEEIVSHPLAWYEGRGVTLIKGDLVETVDPAAKTVTSAAGRTLPYDRLILSTGSKPLARPHGGTSTGSGWTSASEGPRALMTGRTGSTAPTTTPCPGTLSFGRRTRPSSCPGLGSRPFPRCLWSRVGACSAPRGTWRLTHESSHT